MRREEKANIVAELTEKFNNSNFFYVADSSELNVEDVNALRRMCFEQGIELRVTKNTLVKKALDASDKSFDDLYEVLKGPTSLMFTDTSNAPAKLIKEFRKKKEKPVLKAAYIDSDVFIGDDQLGTLADLKSKEELVGEIIGLLQSPAKNVISALQSGKSTLAGLIKTLADRPE